MIGERPDRDRARVLGAAACVASALLMDVPIPATALAERLSVNVKNIGLGGPWNCGDPRIYLSPNRGA